LAIALAQYRVIYLQGIIIMAKAKEQFTEASETDLMAMYEANQSESSELAVSAPSPLLNDKDKDTSLLSFPVVVPLVNLANVLNTLDEIDSYDEGMSFTPRYKEFEDGDKEIPHRIVFMGFKSIQKNESGELKEIKCITWLERKDDGSVDAYMNGGAILINAFEGATSGEPYQITFLGRKKTGSGNYVKDFKVVSLRVPKQLPNH
jgi:hypothetical protein